MSYTKSANRMHCKMSIKEKHHKTNKHSVNIYLAQLTTCLSMSYFPKGKGMVTTASLGDPIITQTFEEPLVTCKVTLNVPGCSLRNSSGNTLMFNKAVSKPTGNNTSMVSELTKLPVQKIKV